MPETTQFGGMEESSHLDGALPRDTVLLARYRILAQLGGGGQGAVYQARDLNFPDARRLVAVKEMLVRHSEPSLRANALKTFTREANILATLAHPAIPKIYDFFDQDDRAYLVMEYINGNDLEAILIKTKKLPMDKIIDWAIELCDVLHYLHEYKPEPIIFRDMKPANIMIDSLGKARLIDFGIAKVFVDTNKPQTMMGTEGYSAPEQYKGKANLLSDIYSLGATLHHIVTRKDPRLEPPFSFAERPIKQFNSEAPDGLDQVLDKALQFDPINRYQTCMEMKRDLEQLRYRPNISIPRIQSGGMGDGQGRQGANGNTHSMSRFIGTGSIDGGIQPKWRFKTEDEIRSGPLVHGNIAYIGSYDTNVWAVDLETGELIWKRATEGGIAATPAIDEQSKQILFGSEDNTFYAVDYKTGKLSWTQETADKIRSSAHVAHGHVFFGSDDGKLYALMASNGRYMWEYDAGAPIRSSAFVTPDRIIFATDTGEVIGLELNGNRKWAFRARRSITSSPFVDMENVCYVGSFDGYVYAIDASSGYSHWRVRTNGPVISSPTVDRNLVYIGSTDGKMYCINTQTGKERWSFDTEQPVVSSPVVVDGVVYFGGTDGKLYAVNARNGQEIWNYQTQGAITSAPFVTKDTILVGSMDKTLYALPLVDY